MEALGAIFHPASAAVAGVSAKTVSPKECGR